MLVYVGECVKFLQLQAESMGLLSTVHYMVPEKPVVIITLQGKNPELSTILLTSHMDVVPVYPVCLMFKYQQVGIIINNGLKIYTCQMTSWWSRRLDQIFIILCR